MESIVVTPNSKRQQSVLISLFREMGVAFAPAPIERKTVSEEDRFYPDLEGIMEQGRQEMKEGRALRLNPTDDLDDFWKKLTSDESV